MHVQHYAEFGSRRFEESGRISGCTFAPGGGTRLSRACLSVLLASFACLFLAVALPFATAQRACATEPPFESSLAAVESELSVFAVNDKFSAPIKNTTIVDGQTVEQEVSCQFMVTGANTCSVIGKGSKGGYTAVADDVTGSLVIPETVTYDQTVYRVTAVGAYAFGSTAAVACTGLQEVTLPRGIESIGMYAFAYCASLERVNFPEGLVSIGERAFANCTELATVQFPSTLTTVGKYAFYYCEQITEVTFPLMVTEVGSYAFCQCAGLKEVVFEGDAPSVGVSAFTGAMTVERVVYKGLALKSTANRFNSETAPQPTFYYTIRFYASEADAQAGRDCLSSAIVPGTLRYMRVTADLNDKQVLYSGQVPAYPEGTNVWRFSESEFRDYLVSQSQNAWAEHSECFDISSGLVDVFDCDYRGEDFTLYADREEIEDAERTELERDVDYTVAYFRQDEQGVWQPTDDRVSPGAVRMVASGMGQYTGQIAAEFNVRFIVGCTFLADIPAPDGSTMKCAFRLVTLNDDGTGTVSVSKKVANTAELLEKKTLFAIDSGYSGELVLPETITVSGNTLAVTGVSSDAFGSSYSHCSLSAVDIPAGVSTIGGRAFMGCTGLRKIVFRGNMDSAQLAGTPFGGCTGLETVVFYGTTPDYSRYNPAKLFPASNVTYYYTITFYESEDALENGAQPLGSATLRDDVLICEVPDKPQAPKLYDGAVPDYPESLIDDTDNPSRSWYAPTWLYPGLDLDNLVAMSGTLTKSVNACAVQRQDAFSMDDAIVKGVQESYDYTGADVLAMSDVSVYASRGGKLVRGVDYEARFEIYDNWEEAWSEVSSTVEAGRYRLVVNGMGKYASESRQRIVDFEVKAYETTIGTTVAVSVPLLSPDGTQAQTQCRFTVTSLGKDRSVMVANGADDLSSSALVDRSTAGAVSIPESVEIGGLQYRVTAVGSAAFSRCSAVTGVGLPESVQSIGARAFCYSGIKSMVLPEAVTEVPQGAFLACSSLESVTLGSKVVSLGENSFTSSALASIEFPETLESIGAGAFRACSSLGEVRIPASLTDYASAFSSSGLKRVSFDDGVASVPAGSFSGLSNLASVDFPATLEAIGDEAFYQSRVEKLTVPAKVRSIGARAFGSCPSLDAVVFEGNPNDCEMDSAFYLTRMVRAVVYRGLPLADAHSVFSSSSVEEYSQVRFYASEDDFAAGVSCGEASVKHGTQYGFVSAESVYDGALPALPEGCAKWVFAGGAAIDDVVSRTTYAIAYAASANDLSEATVLTNRAYRYTGSTINPLNDSTARVIMPDGTLLSRGVHYTAAIQRQNASGEWADTYNLASVGHLRIVVEAIAGSGYTGTAYGYYDITNYLTGSTFEALDGAGHSITYEILSPATADSYGTVQVGSGGRAIADSAAGAIDIPEVVSDPQGASYRVTVIGEKAFYRRMGITSVTVPSSVKTIGAYAFAYESQKTDTKTSNLQTVVFENAMTDTVVGPNAFLNCDRVSAVVYAQKKGTYESLHPFTLDQGVTLTHYYAVRYHGAFDGGSDQLVVAASGEAGDGNVTRVVLREGAYIDSPSATDYYEGSGKVPDLDRGFAWLYDDTALDGERRVTDAQDAYVHEIEDNTITGTVTCVTGAGEVQIPCVYTILTNPAEGSNGTVCVGYLEDGSPAVARDTAGTVVIPETVNSKGAVYTVTEVGAFAFGATEADQACARLAGVRLPATVSYIDQGAFMNCVQLSSVGFAESSALRTVGPAAFAYCSVLRQVALPEGLADIQTSAFAGSGLVRFVLPSTVETLGKRAFDGCAALREFVLAGAYSLDLPQLAGIDSSVDAAAPTGQLQQRSKLARIDDYVFSGCSALERVAFELDMSDVVVSSVAAPGASNVSAVVFGAAKTDVSALWGAAQEYYTVNYFAEADSEGAAAGVSAGERLGYVCLPAGAVPGSFGDDQVYAGAVPAIEGHFEWVSEADLGAPLSDSVSVVRQKIRYDIDTSAMDAAFDVTVRVGSAQASKAAFGDTVSVSASTKAAVSIEALVVSDLATGQEIARLEGNQGVFSMPAGAVSVSAIWEKALSVQVMKTTGELCDPIAVTGAQMRELAAANETQSVQYSAWRPARRELLANTDAYVTLRSLFASVGVRFDSGDTLVLESSTTGKSVSIAFDDLYGEARFTYPGILDYSSEGAYEVDPAFCLRLGRYVTEDDEWRPVSLSDCYTFAFGQTEREFSRMRDTESTWLSQVDSVLVIYGAEDVANCTVADFPRSYFYTGDPVTPAIGLTDVDGNAMVEGVDYTVRYEGNIAAGTAYVIVEGKGTYTGTLKVPFFIKRAQQLAGLSASATSAAIALAAYPDGCDGAIVATVDNFPDALAASSLAGALDYPILLTNGKTLDAVTADALSALSAGHQKFSVVIAGGEAVVSATVEQELLTYVPNENYIARLAGNDLYQTALRICAYGARMGAWSDTAIVVTGYTFPDAMSAAPYAAWSKSPILLCDGKSLSDEVASQLSSGGFTRVVILGGEGAVSANVYAQAEQAVGTGNVIRLWGQTCYDTNLAFNTWALSQGMNMDGAGIATGENFPDGLSSASLLGKTGSALILASPDNMLSYRLLEQNKESIVKLYFLGGSAVVTDAMRASALECLSWDAGAL